MLVARGHKVIGAGDLRWALTFAPRFWAIAVERAGLVLDTRFIPAASAPPRPLACVYLLLDGSFAVHGPEEVSFRGPAAFVATDEQLEGARGARPLTFRSLGEPFRAIEVHVPAGDLGVAPAARFVPLDLDDATWAAAAEVARVGDRDDAALERRVLELLGHFARARLLSTAVTERAVRPTSRPFAVLWSALRPMMERLYLNPTLQEVGDASGLSTRQLDRHVQRFVESFGLMGERWRSTTRHIRLKLAIILLSAEGASIADVAGAVGYGSSDAMARMFRDAGLASPAAVQQKIRAAR